ncbi:MAG: YfiT family bacillithiol transferase [Pyrinomonadaceae bacterium]
MSTATPELDLRFPIGKFDPAAYASREANIDSLANLPANLRTVVDGLSDEQLDTPYRPEGWTLRQTVHHIADSHINTLTRFKLALTEDTPPTIKPYHEERWAELADSKLPVEVSLAIIDGIHSRLVEMLRSLSDAEFQKEFIHPETGPWTIEKATALYAWHSKHHTAHVAGTRERNGW